MNQNMIRLQKEKIMSDIKNLKCYCCKCYDSFYGCTAWSCKDDFEISIDKIKQVSEEYGVSISDITALIDFERRGGSR